VKATLERALAADFPNAAARVYSLEFSTPVGWPPHYQDHLAERSRRENDVARADGEPESKAIGEAA
jgi:hypothetical protein